MRILGLDPGEKRIGVAVTDPLGITAQGIEIIEYASPDKALDKIKSICLEYGVEKIVVGLPLHMSGEKGTAGEKAEEFAEDLRRKLNIPVAMIDERLTSSRVEKTLLEGGLRRRKRREVRDKLAAVLILEQYLTMQKNENMKK
ncbi:MAG: Holliday junction resolvase RuvX [Bacillota bacterium]